MHISVFNFLSVLNSKSLRKKKQVMGKSRLAKHIPLQDLPPNIVTDCWALDFVDRYISG